MNAENARQYLAELANRGDITISKPLSAYNDTYVTRIANALQRQERAGLPPSQQVARGHATREKGKAPTLPAPAGDYQRAKAPRKPPASGMLAGTTGGKQSNVGTRTWGRYNKSHKMQGQVTDTQIVIWDGKSGLRADRVIQHIASVDENAKVRVSYVGKDGKWHTIYINDGKRAAVLLKAIRAAGSFNAWLRSEAASVYGAGKDTAPASGTRQWQIYVETQGDEGVAA